MEVFRVVSGVPELSKEYADSGAAKRFVEGYLSKSESRAKDCIQIRFAIASQSNHLLGFVRLRRCRQHPKS